MLQSIKMVVLKKLLFSLMAQLMKIVPRMFDAISNDQYNCMKQYSRLVDDAAETGYTKYIN